MMKIKFANDHEYQYEDATAIEKEYIAEDMRNTLEITFSDTVNPTVIMNECIDENLGVIVLSNDIEDPETGEVIHIENTYLGYTYVCFAGVREGKPYIKLATGNANQRIINILTGEN